MYHYHFAKVKGNKKKRPSGFHAYKKQRINALESCRLFLWSLDGELQE
jgi:hypothetical protein